MLCIFKNSKGMQLGQETADFWILYSLVDMIPYKDTRIQLFDVLCSDGDRGPNGYGAIVLGMEPSISFV